MSVTRFVELEENRLRKIGDSSALAVPGITLWKNGCGTQAMTS